MTGPDDQIYDLAVSFAGEQRDYVEKVVRACQQLGLSIFYYRDMAIDWWGKSYLAEQRSIYSGRTRFFVPFISPEYLAKPIPMDEFSSALMTALTHGDDYILPVLIKNVTVPVEMLHPHIHYLRAEDYDPQSLALAMKQKVAQSSGAGKPAVKIDSLMGEAAPAPASSGRRLPRVTSHDFSVYQELDNICEYLLDQFTRELPNLAEVGLVGTARRRSDAISVRVENLGRLVYGLDVDRNGGMGDQTITFKFDARSHSSGFNAWATPFFDTATQSAKIKYSDMTAAMYGKSIEQALTKEELFDLLWKRMVESIESAPRTH